MGHTEYSQSHITWWHADDPPSHERTVLIVLDDGSGKAWPGFGNYLYENIWRVGEYTTRHVRCWAEIPEVPDE